MICQPRKSHTQLGSIYFWTATIHKWYCLMENDHQKEQVVHYFKFLSEKGLIDIYGFVIMPNHIHMIWRQNKLNGKESPKASLLKYISHTFLKQLKLEGKSWLYKVDASNKEHEIWQRDSLGIKIYSRAVAKQKLDYIHVNPINGKWKLAKNDIEYKYSSVRFYEYGIDEFGFLKNIFAVFDDD